MAVRSGQATANSHEEIVSWLREALSGIKTTDGRIITGIYYGLISFMVTMCMKTVQSHKEVLSCHYAVAMVFSKQISCGL